MHLHGGFLDYFVVFISGVLVSFTPCVYPVIPMTVGFIAGINTKGTKLTAFLLSLLYVLGMAITYCAFAIFAALTGKIFGQVQNNAIVYFVVASFLTVFALIMMDIIKFAGFNLSIQSKIKRKNVWTVLLFGIITGLVVGPCTAPVLGSLLLYIASKQNLFHGVSLMFVFSYGVGFSLILAGTFSSILGNMPKSGKWLERIKMLCGFIILMVAVYFWIRGVLFLI